VDVSPDGETVAFDLLGDLYLLPIEGDSARRLTSGPSYDIQPRFSPDGGRVLFTSDRDGGDNLWTIRVDGTDPRPVTADKSHVVNSGEWSPDGECVVGRKRLTDASSIGTVELWVYNLLGGTGVGITKKSEIPDASDPVFSPDGRWIYFAYRNSRYAYNRNVYQGIWQIQAYDRKTGNLRSLTDGYGGSARPRVSPDGKTLAFVRRDRARTILVLHDIATGREHVLFEGLDHDMQENFAWTGSYPGYDWMPDGKSLVISFGGGIHRVDATTGSERKIPFTALVEQTVTHALRYPVNIAPDRIRVRMISWPTIDPGGKSLVFAALGRLYRMELPGGVPTPVPALGPRSYAPAFTPDGREIAYVNWSDTEGGHVWVMDAQGRRSRRVTTAGGQYANPAFSADGRKLAFLRGSGATQRGHELGDELWLDLYWSPTRGGEPQYVATLKNRGASRRMPRLSWSPDGTRIFYFEDEGDGEAERTVLASIRTDGTDRRDHLKVRHAEEMMVSPDARWAAFASEFDGYLAALPALGREPIELSGEDGPVPAYRFSREGADWLTWTADGKALTWGQGPFVHRLTLDDIRTAWEKEKKEAGEKTDPALAEAAKAGDKDEKKDEGPKVHPDTLEVKLIVPRYKPLGTVAFRGARIVTMKGEEIVPRGTIVVENDRIVAVGPEDGTPIPAGARVIEAAGKTIIPGLVDVHAHLHYNSLDIIPESVDAYYANLAYGVTTTHDPSASSYTVFTQSEMVEAGITTGPRIFSTGWILYGADLPGKTDVAGLDDAKRAIRRMKRLGAFTVKSYMQPRRDQRQWLLAAAREESIMVVPEGGGNLEMNLSMVLDGHTGIEHSLPVTPLYKDVVTLFARSETGYTPTLLVAYGGLSGEHWFYQHDEVWKNEKLQRFMPRGLLDARARRREVMATDDDWHHMDVAAGAKRILEAGGRVQLGAHGQLQGLGAHWELWALTQGGMRNQDALRVATILGAEYIGLDRWVGSLEPGKLADFVVLDKDPILDIHNSTSIRYVVKNGEVFDGETADRIWPSARPCPPFPWQAQGEMLSPTGGDSPRR
jgi:Tol biopolymer transport system component/imidazolonepropionase-like amidohydrolase